MTIEDLQEVKLPINTKKRMLYFMQNQVKINLKEQKSFTAKYNCNKCRDTTYILVDDEAIHCSCKAVRRAKKILAESGIRGEFSKKSFDNFDYSRNMQTIYFYTVARSYAKDFEKIKVNRKNSVIFIESILSRLEKY